MENQIENIPEKTFVEMFKNGECTENDIETYIDKWHDEYDGKLKLYEYLGMTKEQYNAWLVNPHSLSEMFPKNTNGGDKSNLVVAKALVTLAEELIKA